MLKNLASRIVATAFALALLLSFNASAANEINKGAVESTTVSQKSCAKITDSELIKAVKERLYADADIKDQMFHVNVSVKKRVVKIEGWLSNETLVARAIKIAKDTQCVKRVISKLKTSAKINCGAGQKPCNGVCIDEDSRCTVDEPKTPIDQE